MVEQPGKMGGGDIDCHRQSNPLSTERAGLTSAVGRRSCATANITNDMSPGQLLREARRRHGLTQAQLAARARTSQAAISRIERDLVSPSVATLASLLDLMNEDLLLETRKVDWGHDETLLEANLRKTADERFRDGVSFSRWVGRTRGIAQRR